MTFTNPIRVGDLPRFKEGSPLRSRRDSDAVGLQWRKGEEFGRSNVADRENMRLLMWKINRLRFYKGTGTADGLRLAKPFEYDPLKSYEVNECVRVSPTNPAHVDGASNGIDEEVGGAIVGADGYGAGRDKATAVSFAICVRTPKVLLPEDRQPDDDDAPRNYMVHVPIWPEPGGDPEFPQDPLLPTGPDSPDNYWLIVSLYPKEMTICVNGIDTAFYVHAQPVEEILPPEEEAVPVVITGEGGEEMTGEGGEGMIGEGP